MLSQNECGVDLEIIVSDNSSNDHVQNMIYKEYPRSDKFKYVKRSPTLSSDHNHNKVIVNETTSDYVVLFHDDDILLPDYLTKVVAALSDYPNVSAIGCNAKIIENTKDKVRKKSFNSDRVIEFLNEKDFLLRYLLGGGGVAPWPGYLYRTEFLVQEQLDSCERSGKHQDVMLLSNLINYSKVIWLPEVLMYYRIHTSNISSIETIHDRLRLIRYMSQRGIDRRSREILLYKYLYFLKWAKNKPNKLSSLLKRRSFRTIVKFLISKSLRNFFDIYFWSVIIQRIIHR